jgi:hypothetical protein
MNSELTNMALVDRYAAGADALIRGINGLTPLELNSFPVPSTWSIQQIVMHLVDSDLIASDRMKRIIAETRPLIIGYDETKFAERLHYDKLDAKLAAEVFRGNRLLTAQLLRSIADEDFNREGIHNEMGKIELRRMVENYVAHLDHHVKFLLRKRELLGKPL